MSSSLTVDGRVVTVSPADLAFLEALNEKELLIWAPDGTLRVRKRSRPMVSRFIAIRMLGLPDLESHQQARRISKDNCDLRRENIMIISRVDGGGSALPRGGVIKRREYAPPVEAQ